MTCEEWRACFKNDQLSTAAEMMALLRHAIACPGCGAITRKVFETCERELPAEVRAQCAQRAAADFARLMVAAVLDPELRQ